VFALFLALLTDPPAAASAGGPQRVTICNGMAVELAGAGFDEAGGNTGALTPGACAQVGPVPAGDYTLRFIEHAGKHAALCVRRVAVKPGDTVRITPDDKSSCVV
jgi:hypothetical protein